MEVDSDALDAKLQAFEAAIDKSDPAQVQLLEEMREHTRRLHQARGDWNKPSTFRNWNDPAPRPQATAPLAIESYRWAHIVLRYRHPKQQCLVNILPTTAYREYKNHIAKESHPVGLLAQGVAPKLLEGPAPPPPGPPSDVGGSPPS